MTDRAQKTAWYSYTSSTQTMRTWARVLTSYEDVPVEFRAAFPDDENTFPYTVLIPEDKLSLFNRRNGKILCVYPDHVVLLESQRDQVKTCSSPFTDVLYIEQGKVLLHSWLIIRTLSDTFTMEFNTTNIRYFTPVIETIRQGMNLPSLQVRDPGKNEQELAKFKYLNTLNYKYMNFGRQSIRPGDSVRSIVYQPARCVRTIAFLKKVLFRQYAASHLSILTDQEIILIKENKRFKTKAENLYGGVFTYLPLHRIQNILFTSLPDDSHCTMEIRLSETLKLHSEFSQDHRELEAFQLAWEQHL